MVVIGDGGGLKERSEREPERLHLPFGEMSAYEIRMPKGDIILAVYEKLRDGNGDNRSDLKSRIVNYMVHILC